MRITRLAVPALAVAASALAASPSSAGAASPSSVYGRPLQGLSAYVEPSGLYVSWETSQFARVDSGTGSIQAQRSLAGTLVDLVQAGGWLWAITTTPSNAFTLLRLNPVTLAVTGRLALGQTLDDTGNLAEAGGWLWVAFGGELLRLSLPDGRITARVALPRGTDQSMVAADPAGTTLLDGAAEGGGGALQRRDPHTGRLLASTPMVGVAEPWVGGVIDAGIWVSDAGGHMGLIERLDLTTLKPERLTSPDLDPDGSGDYIMGNNDIGATIADGLVWITQADGGTQYNYCGDPRTGRLIAPISLPQPYQDEVLAIGTRYIYYTDAPETSTRQYLGRIPIPARCSRS
jgi:hypothetical protein